MLRLAHMQSKKLQANEERGEEGGEERPIPEMVNLMDAGIASAILQSDSSHLSSTVSSLQKDASGQIRKKVCTRSDGRVTVEQRNAAGYLAELDIVDNDSIETIKRTSDPFSTLFVGQRVDKRTKALEDVLLTENNLIVRLDHKSKAIVAAERLEYKYNDPLSVPEYFSGTLDADRGFFQYKADNGSVFKQYMARGRWDLLDNDKQMFLSPFKGESATTSGTSAFVKSVDGSSINLINDRSICLSEPSGLTVTENLSGQEQQYLSSHPQTDRRDVAMIHKRLRDFNELVNFYQAVSKFDAATNIPHQQAAAIEDNLLHEVAYPEEIFQGSMGSCNVTTVQRELAVDRPALLAEEIYDVAELGKITTTNGRVFSQDREQLLKRDLSGRDVASRIFQSAAIDVEEQSYGMHFRNTMDGVGRVVNGLGIPSKFTGLTVPQIADIGYALEGETHSMVQVTSVEELAKAIECQQGRAVIAEVDAWMPPFTSTTIGTKRGGHVINISTVTAPDNLAGNARIGYENEWGLASDHSMETTMVDAPTLLKSMSTQSTSDGTRMPRAYGLVLVRGLAQNVQYAFVNGELQAIK